jgi:hypothetical protein
MGGRASKAAIEQGHGFSGQRALGRWCCQDAGASKSSSERPTADTCAAEHGHVREADPDGWATQRSQGRSGRFYGPSPRRKKKISEFLFLFQTTQKYT